MVILLIGSGGREHALAWKLSQDKKVSKIYVAPGNVGTAMLKKCENVCLTTNHELLSFALKHQIDLTVVGPEGPLACGIVDLFKKNNLKIFGPNSAAAKLESSKIFAKNFMKKYRVATANYQTFTSVTQAMKYVKTCTHPIVIKADGLANGKGVIICNNRDDSIKAIKLLMIDNSFNNAGKHIVIEEFLEGVEASIICVCDTKTIVSFISAKDHKTLLADNCGPNTGGMGVVCPNPYVDNKVWDDFTHNILKPTLSGIKDKKLDFHGFIFFGIMITKNGVKNLEYNVRMGDPECQSLVPLMKFSLTDMMLATINQKLSSYKMIWEKKCVVNVVLASKGYPEKPIIGYPIKITKKPLIFFAGAKKSKKGIVTAGGRVLSVVGIGKTIMLAKKDAYDNIKNVSFKDMQYRQDIGGR
ncbi:MAG: phosphoribosylamine--glycine ligase [Mycoplasmataceae bacterium]|nr:phosphoribosylamine--glycine ligase [Mycoplasmataceae bacterium]